MFSPGRRDTLGRHGQASEHDGPGMEVFSACPGRSGSSVQPGCASASSEGSEWMEAPRADGSIG